MGYDELFCMDSSSSEDELRKCWDAFEHSCHPRFGGQKEVYRRGLHHYISIRNHQRKPLDLLILEAERPSIVNEWLRTYRIEKPFAGTMTTALAMLGMWSGLKFYGDEFSAVLGVGAGLLAGTGISVIALSVGTLENYMRRKQQWKEYQESRLISSTISLAK
jgi:hypothetical protein